MKDSALNQTEEEAIAAVREAQKEVAEGKVYHGDLKELLKNLDKC